MLDLLEKNNGDIEKVKSLCHFTTHTPVPAGHDHFSYDRVKKLIRGLLPGKLKLPSLVQDDVFHMTELGLFLAEALMVFLDYMKKSLRTSSNGKK